MDTLTERYVHEVVRRIPAANRDDVGRELHATITDTLEARAEPDRDAAERAVLTEMGDPIRLAARYADRPLALIGPDLYPTYVRLLTLLLATVVPLVTVISTVADVLEHDEFGSAVGAAVGTLVTVGAQVFAWLTLGFFLLSRYPGRAAKARAAAWTPDALPRRRAADRPTAAPIASAAWHAALAGLLIWQQVALPYRAGGGERLPVLDPALWSGLAWPILLGLVALTGLDVVRATGRGSGVRLAAGYVLAEALCTLPLAWTVQRHAIFDPRFLADVNGGWTTPDSFYSVTALVVLGIGVIEAAKRIREARATPAPR
ncbi:hypothetical protein Athai_38330 [Actinocatenispora thailandica]|uniref:Uncharacterized protein n=1 Tax=Actinocatenispora thailandica TaxID=227318 RepID=A0A7R7DR19_9ACTN|nr:hypothetical protein [Actinocatenispora thailandica]BCJ36330.1 hypothetical protein Athai_38330 [Actinocatenispora thailandica]